MREKEKALSAEKNLAAVVRRRPPRPSPPQIPEKKKKKKKKKALRAPRRKMQLFCSSPSLWFPRRKPFFCACALAEE